MKMSLHNKAYSFCLLLLCVLIIIDLFTRLNVKPAENNAAAQQQWTRPFKAVVADSPPKYDLEITGLFGKPITVKAIAAPKPSGDQVEQLTIAGKMLRLSGLFRSNLQQLALIEVRVAGSSTWSKQAVRLGADLYGYRIEKIADRSVILKNKDQTIELVIFKHDKS